MLRLVQILEVIAREISGTNMELRCKRRERREFRGFRPIRESVQWLSEAYRQSGSAAERVPGLRSPHGLGLIVIGKCPIQIAIPRPQLGAIDPGVLISRIQRNCDIEIGARLRESVQPLQYQRALNEMRRRFWVGANGLFEVRQGVVVLLQYSMDRRAQAERKRARFGCSGNARGEILQRRLQATLSGITGRSNRLHLDNCQSDRIEKMVEPSEIVGTGALFGRQGRLVQYASAGAYRFRNLIFSSDTIVLFGHAACVVVLLGVTDARSASEHRSAHHGCGSQANTGFDSLYRIVKFEVDDTHLESSDSLQNTALLVARAFAITNGCSAASTQ